MIHMQMLFPGGKTHALTLSYDDAVTQDARLIALFEKYGVKATFNLDTGCFAPEGVIYPQGTTRRRMTQEECRKIYRSPCCEVAAHTVSHAQLDAIPDHLVLREVIEDRLELEKMFDRPVLGLAYPMGRTSKRVMELLRGTGILYARGAVQNYSFALPENWLHWQPTCRHAEAELPDVADDFLKTKMGYDGPLVFMLMGHGYEFDEQNNWHVIEDFLKKMAGHDFIWYATCLEIARVHQRFTRLECSASGREIYNPSFEEVWVQINSKAYCIPGGETLKI